ncbi:uncharacterized protein LOC122852894 [Aphidius gifuensis]|uniref:Odorant receptor n=1 Tax=Aphidius gifuensis TaxID=684658 RepID=A0A3S5HSS3_APHGI|nr:uncharacterized protein LOC122852894 [Aphidius gifuensis]AZQ24910.1 odorant receptor [Aphidius gifuensis]
MDNSNNWIKFEKLLNFEKYLLQIFGLLSMKTLFLNKPYVKNIYGTFIFSISLTVIISLTFLNIIYVISAWENDIDSVMIMVPVVFGQIIAIPKGMIIWFYQEDLYNVLDNLQEKWNKSFTRTEIHDQILEQAIKITKFRNIYVFIFTILLIVYVYSPISTILIYFYKNTNESFDFNQTMWPSDIYQIKINTFLKYIFISTIEIYHAYIYILYCQVGEIFYIQMFTHISIQFKILANDIITTVKTDRDSNSKTLSMELKYIIMRHQELYKLFDLMNDKFYSSVIFSSFVIGSINMCFNIFQFQRAFNQGNYFAASRSLILTLSIFFEMTLYCIQAEIICASAELIPESVYNSQWSNIDKNSMLTLQIIMTCSQKKLTCGAYGLVNIDHEQITQVCRRTFSFFVFLDSIQS